MWWEAWWNTWCKYVIPPWMGRHWSGARWQKYYAGVLRVAVCAVANSLSLQRLQDLSFRTCSTDMHGLLVYSLFIRIYVLVGGDWNVFYLFWKYNRSEISEPIQKLRFIAQIYRS